MGQPRYYTFIREWTDELVVFIGGQDPPVIVVELDYTVDDPLADAQKRAIAAAADHYEMPEPQFEAETIDVMTIFMDISSHIEIEYVRAELP